MVINVGTSCSVYGKPMRLHAASDLEYLIGLRSNQPLSKDQIRAAVSIRFSIVKTLLARDSSEMRHISSSFLCRRRPFPD